MNKRLFAILIAIMFAVSLCEGAALTAARNTPRRSGRKVNLTVANDAVIYAGAMVAVDSNAEATNAADIAGQQVVGRAGETVDNSADGETIDVDIGIFGWANAGDITDAHIGDICYVVDNQTVSVATNGSHSIIAGVVFAVDDSYAWVSTMFKDRSSVSASSLSVSGSSTLTGPVVCSAALTVSGGVTNSSTTVMTGDATCSDDFTVVGATSLGGNTTNAGTLTVTGNATFSSNMFAGVSTWATYEGGETNTVNSRLVLLTPTGVGTQYLANPVAQGQMVTIANQWETNVTFITAGPLYVDGDCLLASNSTLTLIAMTSTNWVEVSRTIQP